MRLSVSRLMARSVAACLMAVAATVSLAPPATAAYACSTRSNYLAGATSAFNSTVFGARARIEYNNPDLCGNDSTGPSFSVAWSMVTAGSATSSSPSRDGWAQAGFGQFGSGAGFGDSGLHVFSQYTLKCKNTGTCGSTNPYITTFGGTVSTTHYYENYVRASDGRIRMGVDGTVLDVTNYDPSGDWDPDYAGQFAGETGHAASDVPGTSSDPTSFDYVQKYNSNGSISFFSNISRVTSTAARHKSAEFSPGSGGQGLNIWTSPLTGP